jgi:hypothetical protein
MPKYRFTFRSEYVTTVDIEADNEVDAYEEMRAYIEDGGTGERGWWNTRDYDEPERVCPHCSEPAENIFNIPCCQDAAKERIKNDTSKESTKGED